jgi:hypothetical protein
MWRFRALGKRSLPVLQDLYSYPEEEPRMAALEAGAALDDALASMPLVAMAASGGPNNRIRAIELLAKFGFNPDIDLGLRPLLDDADPDVKLAAYETLLKRFDPVVRVMDIDGKFDVALVPSKSRMIYVTQSGRPTIAVFGDDTVVSRPVTHSAWNNRLMIKADDSDDELQVFYRASEDERPEIHLVDAHLSEFIPFLGHQVTVEKPLPGIGLSYGETIGAIHSLWRARHIDADFKAEQDRILAAILRNSAGDEQANRPDFEPEADPGAEPGAPAAASDLTGIAPPPPVEVPRQRRDTVPR